MSRYFVRCIFEVTVEEIDEDAAREHAVTELCEGGMGDDFYTEVEALPADDAL